MNSHKRFMTALRGGQPDRVPVFELFIHPQIIDALDPGADLADFVDNFDLDAISSLWMVDGTIREERLTDQITIDEWGVTWQYGDEGRAPIAGPIQSLADIKHYTVPDPDAPYRLETLRKYVSRFKERRTVIYQGRYGFMWAADLRKLDRFLMDMLDNPQLAHALLEMTCDFAIRLATNAIASGADVIVVGDDVAFRTGLMLSPALFREFLLPHFQRFVDSVHAAGALCIKHSDGNIWKIMDMIASSGVNGINPLEPIAGMDIGKVKRIYGDRLCLLGNIDCGELLCRGTPEQVAQTVRDTIRVAAPGGGYILSSSNSIHSAVKPENYSAMLRAAREYGGYPLKLD
jgi:uroporphyrinogen decarboxylase